MTSPASSTLLAIALLLIPGCALVDRARIYGAEAAGRAVALECALAVPERQANLAAINGWLLANNIVGRGTALDCDGDGVPDF